MTDYIVRDISLADWGNKEIAIAETEMPGLMALRDEFGAAKPLKGARIAGSLHMTIQTAVLIQTLEALGAEVRWGLVQTSFSTQGTTPPPPSPPTGPRSFATKGETLEEYWDYAHKIFEWADGGLSEPDPGRRRRRHPADGAGPQGREGHLGPGQSAETRKRKPCSPS